MQVTFDSDLATYVSTTLIWNSNFLGGFGTNTLLVIPCKSRELIKRIEIYYRLGYELGI
jgi:hypothetical protein